MYHSRDFFILYFFLMEIHSRQGLTVQASVSFLSPHTGQSPPPVDTHPLVLVLLPSSHFSEHSDHSPHSVQKLADPPSEETPRMKLRTSGSSTRA